MQLLSLICRKVKGALRKSSDRHRGVSRARLKSAEDYRERETCNRMIYGGLIRELSKRNWHINDNPESGISRSSVAPSQ